MNSEKDAWKNVGAAGSLGFTLVATTFLGLAAGYLLDKWLDTSPCFMISLLALGIGAGFFNMIYYGLTHKGDSK
jgi:ATP synthase protein I